MVKKTVKDIEASIRARLLNLSKETGENYYAVLLRFCQERFLARLGNSPYREHFVLKGGLLLLTRHITPFRPTVDIDMLGIAISHDPQHLSTVIQEISGLELNDGVRFDTDKIMYSVIKEDAEYEGIRFTFGVHLGKIRSRMQLDIGFGDEVPIPFTKSALSPMLTDLSVPELLLYPLESVIAEKFQAIVYLGLATSRMKDFYDILFLSENNIFILKKLKMAIKATFIKRETDIENRYYIYDPEYISEKEKLWKPFMKKIVSDEHVEFSQVIRRIKEFLEPVINTGEDKGDFRWDLNTRQWKKSQ